jgi:hypothetical protein
MHSSRRTSAAIALGFALVLVLSGVVLYRAQDDATESAPDAAVRAVNEVAAPALEASTVDAGLLTKDDGGVPDAGKGSVQVVTASGAATTCKVLYGPEEQPFRGPAAMRVHQGTLEFWLNDRGTPRIHKLPARAPAGAVKPVPLRGDGFAVFYPPCALGEDVVYCIGQSGKVLRSALATGGAAAKEIVTIKPGTRLLAAGLGAGHTVLGYLESRRTSEGATLEAWAVLDDQSPVRISDDGAGATSLALGTRPRASQKDLEVIALSIDARVAMTPVHARALSIAADSPKLVLSADTVLYVGGPPESSTAATLALSLSASTSPTAPRSFALLPIGIDALRFGLAAIPLEQPLRENVAAEVSEYPSLDPSLVATAASNAFTYVVRLRSTTASKPDLQVNPDARSTLELGKLDVKGHFQSLEIWTVAARVTDLSLLRDSFGTLWILYGDASGMWIERRQCAD